MSRCSACVCPDAVCQTAALLHYGLTVSYENIETGAPAKHPPVSDRQRHRVQGHSRGPFRWLQVAPSISLADFLQ